MSIRIIQGPHAQSPCTEVLHQLQQLATAAGRTLELCPCGCLPDLIDQVRATEAGTTEFMLLDLGDLAYQAKNHPEAGLDGALDELNTPYVEVHEESGAELDLSIGLHHAPIATVIIHGDIGSSYRIGLGIALRQLSMRQAA
jgi:3-dehydroquinate dehydratase-2